MNWMVISNINFRKKSTEVIKQKNIIEESTKSELKTKFSYEFVFEMKRIICFVKGEALDGSRNERGETFLKFETFFLTCVWKLLYFSFSNWR